MQSNGGRLLYFLGKHLNDACKLSEFAMQSFQTICMFFRCFQSFFNSVKYFNKPKPCGIFFRCLNCAPDPTLPSHFFCLSFFQFFIHLVFVCGFCEVTILVCLPPNSFLIPSINVVNKSFCCGDLQKSFSVLKKSVHLNLFHRITILFHKLCIWTISVWSSKLF